MKKFLILGIIVILIGISQSYAEEPLSVSIDKTFYDDGDLITISGFADPTLVQENFLEGIPEPQIIRLPVTIQIISSAGDLTEIAQLEIESDGSFLHKVLATGPQWQNPGLYTIKAAHGENSAVIQFWYKFDGGAIPEQVTESESQVEPELTIHLDKTEVYWDETLAISGKISPVDDRVSIAIIMYDPLGNQLGTGSGSSEKNGEFVWLESGWGGKEPGVYTIRVKAADLWAESQITILGPRPEPQPTLQLDQLAYSLDDTITVSGATFNNERQVSIEIANSQNEIIVSDSVLPLLDGTFSKTYLSSSPLWDASGPYKITATSGPQNVESTFNFTGIELECGPGTVENEEGFCVPDRATMTTEMQQKSSGGGCLIATATFGSELAPQVQMLREIRDNSLLQTESGRSFMESFNQFYYSFSPGVADLEREYPLFKETVKLGITPLITSLSILNYVDVDSEIEMLGYGISLILLNVGMYFVAPTLTVIQLKRFFVD